MNRRKASNTSKVSKKRKSQEPARQISDQDLMNSSLSRMLDQQILMANSSQERNKVIKPRESLTYNQWHGDKIYMNNGAMAFKPLAVETVLETVQERQEPNRTSKWNMAQNGQRTHSQAQSQFGKNSASRRLDPRTTEQNLAMQQRLDQATAEELFYFPRHSMLNLQVTEDYSDSKYSLPQKKRSASQMTLNQTANKNAQGMIQSRSASKELIHPIVVQQPNVRGSQSNKRISGVLPPEEARQVHQGLQKFTKQKYQQRAQPETASDESPREHASQGIQVIEHQRNSQQARGQSITGGESADPKPPPPKVKQRVTVAVKPSVPIQDLISQKLHRQKTGNEKSVARKLRDMKYENEDQTNLLLEAAQEGKDSEEQEQEDKLTVSTVMEKPLPMPHRMRSNFTFQPKVNQLRMVENNHEMEEEAVVDSSAVQDDKLSQLAKDYKLHLKNQQTIQTLMSLVAGGREVEDFSIYDINLGESMSNVDAVSSSNIDAKESAKTKLPNIASKNKQKFKQGSIRVADDAGAVGSIELGSDQQKDSIAQLKTAKTALSQKKKKEDASTDSRLGTNQRHSYENQVDLFSNVHETSVNQQNEQSFDAIQPHASALPMKLSGDQPSQYSDYNSQRSSSHMKLEGAGAQQKRRMYLLPNSSVQRQSINSKYKQVMRSSMFNKHPVLDTTQAPADSDSEFSLAGRQSHMRFSSKDDMKYKSQASPRVWPKMRQNHSNRKLQPILPYNTKTEFRETSKDADRMSRYDSQSLQFKQGLTYVMVKGKVQPSEKYIYRNMLPYTNANSFSQVQIKSSQNRHQVTLQKASNSNIKIPSNYQTATILQSHAGARRFTNKVPIQQNAKSRKLKASSKVRKATREALGEALKQQTHQYQTESNLDASGKKKAVIVEMAEEEHSGSEAGITTIIDTSTWQEIQEENEQLKQQIQNQIGIFEQYLKVAILQHKQRQRALDALKKNKGSMQEIEETEVMLKEGLDYEYDEEPLDSPAKQHQESLFKSAQRKQNRTQSRKPNATIIQRLPIKQVPYQQQRDSHALRNNQSSSMEEVEVFVPSSSNATRNRAARSRQNSARSNKSGARSATSKKRRNLGSSKSPSKQLLSLEKQRTSKNFRTHNLIGQMSAGSTSSDGSPNTFQKARFINMSRKITDSSKIRALEHLMPFTGEKHTHQSTHQAHQLLIHKIEKLWKRLNRRRWSEVQRIHDEIKRNKKHIQQLTRDNMFELDVNFHDQRVFVKQLGKKIKVQKQLKRMPDERRIQILQKRYRAELHRKQDFDTWGLNNHLISYRIQIRMTEDIIDCAQRLTVQADHKTQRELELLKLLRERTYEDLSSFVREREKKRWRLWEGFNSYKPQIENAELSLQQLQERVEIHLQMIAYVEPRHLQLVMRDIPPYNLLNSEMIQFCTEVFGNEGWLQLFSIKQLRRQQEAEQHDKQYMPPVEQIKNLLVDPYTLQVLEGQSGDEMGDEPFNDRDDEILSDDKEGVAARYEAVPIPSKPTGWDLRKPDTMTASKLKTGYETIIKRQQTEKMMKQQTLLMRDEEGAQSVIPESNNEDTEENWLRKSQNSLANANQEEANEDNMFDQQLLASATGLQQARKTVPPLPLNQRLSMAKAGLKMQYTMKDGKAIKGGGANKFSGDVIQHLKNQADEADVKEEQEMYEQAIKKSSWLQTLEKEKEEKAQRDALERKARAARLANLFEEEDGLSQDDDADLLDAGAADQDVKGFMEKIDTHLKVEKRLLEAWQEKDKTPPEGAGAAASAQ